MEEMLEYLERSEKTKVDEQWKQHDVFAYVCRVFSLFTSFVFFLHVSLARETNNEVLLFFILFWGGWGRGRESWVLHCSKVQIFVSREGNFFKTSFIGELHNR